MKFPKGGNADEAVELPACWQYAARIVTAEDTVSEGHCVMQALIVALKLEVQTLVELGYEEPRQLKRQSTVGLVPA